MRADKFCMSSEPSVASAPWPLGRLSVNALEDPTLVEAIKERGLGLTVCPISNGYVTDSMKADAIRRMLDLACESRSTPTIPRTFLGTCKRT